MKKTTKVIVFTAVFLVSAVIFSSANAITREVKRSTSDSATTTAKEKNTSAAGKLFCDKIGNLLSSTDQKTSDFNAKLQEKRNQRLKGMDDAREKRDVKLKEVRNRWMENRQEQFAKLAEKATTDAQKQAVASFKAGVTKAISTRQQAVDVAVEIYRNGLDKIVSDRKIAVDAAKNALRNSVKVAHDKAKADCVANVDPKITRENLQASLKAAREKYVVDVQALEKNRTQTMQQLLATRKEAVKKALDDFRASMEKLRTELKVAFGQTVSDTSVSQ